MQGKPSELAGRVFGKLTAIACLGIWHRNKRWICECSCGNISTVSSSDLLGYKIQSCGCNWIREPGAAARDDVISEYKRGALKRGHSWGLTTADFHRLSQLPCRYCGISPSTRTKLPRTNGQFVYNGLDRVDNLRGYELTNVVTCCRTCNRAKWTMSAEEFVTWARRVSKFNEVN
jgi:5-methylcytosine-specific restriction endonuclease McrA